MEQQSPTMSVSRSVVYLATHVYKEIPQDELELMDPNSYEVKCREYVFGVDDIGCVRGMGGGISKTELLASVVPREQL
ncbi:hypothetical protein MKW98_026395 [Papaver atlanticum]|uniref:Uncharacterized protein n=1 Tax=Papaver atlanticum TaxID=357466 RepID=A0AAD4XH55_9MAGN|nr:hypothetical protein MKW98_026395 [Papaver atlanticum]